MGRKEDEVDCEGMWIGRLYRNLTALRDVASRIVLERVMFTYAAQQVKFSALLKVRSLPSSADAERVSWMSSSGIKPQAFEEEETAVLKAWIRI